jgi:GntR family transcriptional repressor for pyruvate dehydrogenase complex
MTEAARGEVVGGARGVPIASSEFVISNGGAVADRSRGVGSVTWPSASAPPDSEPPAARRRNRVLLGSQVAVEIADHIRTEGLDPGTPLPSEAALADAYDVSQRVIRDALRQLSQQGVIETQQGKRAVVSELRPVAVQGYFKLAVDADSDAVGELFELRQALETKAAGMAAKRISSDEVDALRELLAESDGAAIDRRVELDLRFHSQIVRAAGNRFFVAIHDALAEVLAAERRRGQELTESAGRDHAESNTEHRAIVRSLSAGSAAAAEKAMDAHLERTRRQFEHPF